MRLHPAPTTSDVDPPPGRLRVLQIVSGFPKLSETFVVDQIVGLLARGAHVDIWALDDPAETTIAPEVTAAGLLGRTRYLDLPTDARSAEEWLLRFDRANGITPADLLRYDVVHVNFGPVFVGLEPLLAFADVPVVVSFYGYDLASFVTAHGPGAYEHLFRRAALTTAVSEDGRQRLVELGCPPDRTAVQRAGIRLDDRWTTGPTSDRTGPIELLTVARFVDKKGVDDAIRAVAAMRSDARLRIIGDGPLRPQLEDLVDRLGVRSRVTFAGSRTRAEVESAMRSADVVVQLSRTAADGDQEGIPVVLVMAAAAGRPIVATRHSGIPELVDDGTGGLLVDERDHAAAGSMLDRLVADPELRARLGRGARDRCAEAFDQDRLDEQLHAQLGEVVATHRRGAIETVSTALLRRAALSAQGPTVGECPVCDAEVTFDATPDHEPLACPRCGSSAPVRSIVRFLLDRTDLLDAPSRVLTVDAPAPLRDELDAVLGERHRAATGAEVTRLADQRFTLVVPPPERPLDADAVRGYRDLVEPGGRVVGWSTGHSDPTDPVLRLGLGMVRHDPTGLWDDAELRSSGIDPGLGICAAVRPTSPLPSPLPGEPDVGVVISADGAGDVAATVTSTLDQRRAASRIVVVAGPGLVATTAAKIDARGRIELVEVGDEDVVGGARQVADRLATGLTVLLRAGEILRPDAIDAALRSAMRSPDAGVIVGDSVVVGRDGGAADRIVVPDRYHRPGAEHDVPGRFVRRQADPGIVCHAGTVLLERPADRPTRPTDTAVAGFVVHAARSGTSAEVWDDLRPGLAALHAFGGDRPTVLAWQGDAPPSRLPPSVTPLRLGEIVDAGEATELAADHLPSGLVLLVDERVVIGPDSVDELLADIATIEVTVGTWSRISARCDAADGTQRGPTPPDAVRSIEPTEDDETTLTAVSAAPPNAPRFVSRSYVHRP